METGKEIISRLEDQQDHYLSLREAMRRQTRHIQAKDVVGLTTDTVEVRELMMKVRDIEVSLRPLRQSWNNLGLDRVPGERRKIDALVVSIRELLEEIQADKDENSRLLKDGMKDLRSQLTGLEKQSNAAKAYYGRPGARASGVSKFIDKAK